MKAFLLTLYFFCASFLSMQGMNIKSPSHNFFAPLNMPKFQRKVLSDPSKNIGLELLYFKRQCNPKKDSSIFIKLSAIKVAFVNFFRFS